MFLILDIVLDNRSFEKILSIVNEIQRTFEIDRHY